jgi:hypothetical protein
LFSSLVLTTKPLLVLLKLFKYFPQIKQGNGMSFFIIPSIDSEKHYFLFPFPFTEDLWYLYHF